MVFVAQLLPDSSSLCTLRPVVRFGPSLVSLIPVDILRETRKRWVPVFTVFLHVGFNECRSERPCCIPWEL